MVTSSNEVRWAMRVWWAEASMGSRVRYTCRLPFCVDTASNWPSSDQFNRSRPRSSSMLIMANISFRSERSWILMLLVINGNYHAHVDHNICKKDFSIEGYTSKFNIYCNFKALNFISLSIDIMVPHWHLVKVPYWYLGKSFTYSEILFTVDIIITSYPHKRPPYWVQ